MNQHTIIEFEWQNEESESSQVEERNLLANREKVDGIELLLRVTTMLHRRRRTASDVIRGVADDRVRMIQSTLFTIDKSDREAPDRLHIAFL